MLNIRELAADYTRIAYEEVTVVGATRDATVICSRTSSKTHAPVLDVDHPAALSINAAGRYVLWVAGLEPDRMHKTSRALERAGLAEHPARPLDAQTRSAGWSKARVIDAHALAHALSPGEHTTASFADLVNATLASFADDDGRTILPVVARRPDLGATPYPLVLTGPALLLPSTHNWHLYLDTELTDKAWRRLMKGLRGLLEPGYVSVSLANGEAHVRVPWIHKTA